ncbi:esterase-like activity of phytase family protein [Sphingomonas donggukensis]|uniref:Esterase-like activity of phytase family protein n=1 Tax=Sphingomonas donggukensis TaxID=2949093 RepID=A0ABY4TSF7_9SPHN|nr:esterase-like activity of phytase family protein [Sphingomonas donggukensis]URW75345.1 esterase-like activity of phytase family protein [Sphingomonas donggukensis]
MRALLIVLLVLMLVPGWSGEPRLALYDGTPGVTVARVTLADDPAVRRVGALTFLGGLHFSSRDPAFGGFSALTVTGDRFDLLSDGGLTFGFRMGGDLRPHDYRFAALPAGPGVGWKKEDRDSESMAVDPASGRVWVGFERADAIWRYAPGFARVERSARPAPMRHWPDNGGAEALVRLRDGRFLVFAESARAKGGGTQAVAFDRDPTLGGARAFAFRYRAPPGYRVTDAAELPDGRLVVLHRAATIRDGFTATVSLVDARAVRPGALVTGREVARLAAPLIHDNFEGVAVTREGGATILWLVSDDNAPSLFQRTLLLKFRLDDARTNETPR